ncbi:hypothetical protein V3C99_007184 [Haemonchus contortus]
MAPVTIQPSIIFDLPKKGFVHGCFHHQLDLRRSGAVMSLRAVLVILVVAVVMVLCHALPIDDTGADYGNLENFFYLPRLRRDQLAFSGQNAYLRQLLQNLKPKFRRSV